ncbi:MAG: hypothetical protein IPP15_06555 [Saprospiraceae bacterium]|uniref:Uncharacterized protein n=1 Tax=Candidatus Opimibacter skivensis TaxID=2982028 RepID=A0A9D7XS41_9BACT|nr:hypothetical protein [Candidatus Opimibacter skivensis]
MIKILLFIIYTLTTVHSFAQTDKNQNDIATNQNTNVVPYRLFPTQNMWTFIKLNTRNGRMWQVQFSLNEDNRFVTILSSETLVTSDKEVNDRFFLYPTTNIYTFILLDQLDGRTWQVQWSIDPQNRGIIPID